MSAALKPALVTTRVCGEPFVFGASPSFLGSANCSRNSGRLSRLRAFRKDEVSVIYLAGSDFRK